MTYEEFKKNLAEKAEGNLADSVSAEAIFEALYNLEQADEQMEKFYDVLRRLSASESDFNDFESAQMDMNHAASLLMKAVGYYPEGTGDTSFMDQFSAE